MEADDSPDARDATDATDGPDTTDSRWPRSVYGVGDEPDPRFTLANERTFLAWVRTTLALLAASAAVDALTLPMPAWLQRALAAAFALLGLLTATQSYRSWAATERAMRLRRPLPMSSAMVPLVAVVGLVALTLALVPLLRGR